MLKVSETVIRRALLAEKLSSHFVTTSAMYDNSLTGKKNLFVA